MAPILRVSIAYLAYFSAVGAASPYLFLYYSHLGLGLAEIGALAALSAAVGLVVSPAWGALADHFAQTRLTLPLAALVAIGGALILATGHDLVQIGAGVVVLAAGLGGLGPILDARAIETLGPDRGLYGRVRALGSAAFVVGAWAVGILIDLDGLASLFLAYIPALLVTAVVSVSLVRRPAIRSVGIVHGTVDLVRAPGMRLFMLGSFLVWTALVAVNSFMSIRMEAVGGAAATVGLVWAVGAAVEVPVMWWFARLVRRFGVGRLMVAGAVLFAVRAGVAAVAGDPPTLLVTAPIAGVAIGLFFIGAVNFVAERAPGGLAATAQGLFSAVLGLATIVGSAVSGVLAGWLSIPGMFGLAAVTSVLATAVVALAVGWVRRPVPVVETGGSI